MADFGPALCFVLQAEGEESDDPNDPGGLTRYGISSRAHPDVDVGHLTEKAAADIYLARYWEPMQLERLPQRLAVAVFDGAVQHGCRTSARILQDTIGVTVDGKIGPITVAAAWRKDGTDTLVGYISRRGVFYGYLPHFQVYGLGWNQRLFRLLLYTQSL